MSLAEWADLVAEMANRRTPLWKDRLNRAVEYDRGRLGEIARAAHRGGILSDETGLRLVESGLLALEMPWQREWNIRTNVLRDVMGHA